MRNILLAVAILFGLGAGQAFAHAKLVRADPAVGSTVRAAPTTIWLKFDEVPRLPGSGVILIAPDGQKTLLGPLSHDPSDPLALRAPTPHDLMPGRYGVHWGALSSGAHHTQGDFAFTIQP